MQTHKHTCTGADAWETTGVHTRVEEEAGSACTDFLHSLFHIVNANCQKAFACGFIHGMSYDRYVVEVVLIFKLQTKTKLNEQEMPYFLHVTDALIANGFAVADASQSKEHKSQHDYYNALEAAARERHLGCHDKTKYPNLPTPAQQRANYTATLNSAQTKHS
jgi:endonuclease YncB( thermonuclease family)